ncbi:MAG: periplasmic heavy metal sensor [Steroidobacteraceae bacterium]
MNARLRTTAALVVCTLLAALVGGWFGVRYGLGGVGHDQRLDQLLHHELKLSSEQERQIAALESAFSARREVLESQMREANRDLAQAIAVRHQYDSAGKEAVNHLHESMMNLQEASIGHVLAMRTVLTPAQAEQFDRTISKALTAGAP